MLNLRKGSVLNLLNSLRNSVEVHDVLKINGSGGFII